MTVRKAIIIESVVLFLACLTFLSEIVIWYYALTHSPTPEVLIDDDKKREFITPALLQWNVLQKLANVNIHKDCHTGTQSALKREDKQTFY
jgi:hypothetical protein